MCAFDQERSTSQQGLLLVAAPSPHKSPRARGAWSLQLSTVSVPPFPPHPDVKSPDAALTEAPAVSEIDPFFLPKADGDAKVLTKAER